MDLISHPFRLEANGAVATVEDDTDDAYAEGIAVLALTRKGERELAPGFGITDPTFTDLGLAELNVGLADFGPPVEVSVVEVTYPNDTTERVTLAFTATDEE